MNRASTMTLNRSNTARSCTDMAGLEEQNGGARWQQEKLLKQGDYGSLYSAPVQLSQVQSFPGFTGGGESAFGEVMIRSVKPNPGLETGWPELGKYEIPNLGFGASGLVKGTEYEMNYAISRTLSCCLPSAKGTESALSEKMRPTAAKESFDKKRKADKMQRTRAGDAEDGKDKKIKLCAEEPKITDHNRTRNNSTTTTTNDNRETSTDTSKDNSKATEIQQHDYIHVRARRGQATDSHSLAERVRREKISERMRYLQDLVPGCNKIIGKAGMLDEIINYVQSLQQQVEFLSMKLAALNPSLDLDIDNPFAKQAFPTPTSMSTETMNPAYLQLNPAQQLVSCYEFGMETSPDDTVLHISNQETFLDSPCFTQNQSFSTWDDHLENVYSVAFNQGR